MNYYYDVLLNFCSDNIYEFYEWEKSDPIDYVKKIPIFKVNNKMIIDILQNNVSINKEFITSIENKTILKKQNKEIRYASILTDGKNSIAIETNDMGKITYISKLLLEDENNINEIAFTLKKEVINYEIISKRTIDNELRQLKRIKKLIQLELKELLKSKNYNKLKYLYIEWFDKDIKSINNMIKDMIKDLSSINDKHFKIYNIIKESYKKEKL